MGEASTKMKKIIFGLNLTDDKKNDQTDEQPLVTKRLTDWQQEELARTSEKVNEILKRATLPTGWLIAKAISGSLALLIGIGILRAIVHDLTFEQVYHNAPYLIIALPVLVAGWLVLFVLEKKRKATVGKSTELVQIKNRAEAAATHSADELSLPEDTVEMDFLTYRYRIKNGEIKIRPFLMATHLSVSMRAFVQDGKLCLADLEQLVEIPLKDFTSIERVNKNAMIPQWNKDVPWTKEPYKKYKLKNNQYGTIYVKPYYLVDFAIDGQVYELSVPVYEIAPFIALTHIEYHDEFTE